MIQDIAIALSSSTAPITKAYYENDKTKIIAIGLKKDVVLAKHTAPSKAQILIIQGAVTFRTATFSKSINTYETFEIPLEVVHEVIGDTDSIFLLILSK